MTTKTDYRVDRTDQPRTPCGMNSIIYLGDDPYDARAVFESANPGFTGWNEESATHGVVLSRWSYAEGDYVVIASKFPTVN